MLHQSFLSKSFKDARYTYTRWATATAAKNIINLCTARDPDEPQRWVEQAFVVTAGICLILDMFHRPNSDPEAVEYHAYVQRAIQHLQQFVTSSVALHGVRLLLSLIQEYSRLQEGSRPRTAPTNMCACVPANITDIQIPEAARETHGQCLNPSSEVPPSSDEATQFNFDIDMVAFEDLMDYLPTEGSLDNSVFLDSMYGLTTGQSAS
jgi:transcription elongation factor SPT5